MTKTDWVVSKTLHVITFTLFRFLTVFQNRKKRDFLRFCFVAYVFSDNGDNVLMRHESGRQLGISDIVVGRVSRVTGQLSDGPRGSQNMIRCQLWISYRYDFDAISSESLEPVSWRGRCTVNPGCVSTGCTPEPISIYSVSRALPAVTQSVEYAIPCRLSNNLSPFRCC